MSASADDRKRFLFGRRALDLSRNHKERGHEAWALRLLGELASPPNPSDVGTTEGRYHQAMALAGELGMGLLLAHCHLGLGALYSKIGRREEARTELTTALELSRSMEMRFWLGRAEAELAKASS